MATTNSKSSDLWAVQAPERPGQPDPRILYRRGFRDFIAKRLPQANVVLLEPDPERIPNLRHLWEGHPSHQIVNAVWCEATDCPGTHTLYSIDMPDGEKALAEDEFQVRRLNPAADPSPIELPCWSLKTIDPGSSIHALSLDTALPSAVANTGQVMSRGIRRWLIASQDVLPETVDNVRAALRNVGYQNAGRPWGAAGSCMQLVQADDFHEHVDAWVGQARSRVGQTIVEVRERMPLGDRFRALVRRTEYPFTAGLSSHSNIDPSFGLPLSPIDPQLVESAVHAVLSATSEFDLNVSEDHPDAVARECHSKLGFFPISFSHPTVTPLRPTEHRLSPIIPGFPYSFDEQDDYTNHYASCEMALTHRKAGWDCFRHVEIGASGAIPLMPDADELPPYAMIHYPKKSLASIQRQVLLGLAPGPEIREALRSHFLRHQTTKSMAEYVIRHSGAPSADRVLFIDEELPSQADYLSVLTLIGLKELFAERCEVMCPVDYIYQDSTVRTRELYGRGFGYTKLLPGESRSPSELSPPAQSTAAPDPSVHDLVIIGSLYRNQEAFSHVMRSFPADRVIVLYGEDTPPTSTLTRGMRESGATVFMRPIHYRRLR